MFLEYYKKEVLKMQLEPPEIPRSIYNSKVKSCPNLDKKIIY